MSFFLRIGHILKKWCTGPWPWPMPSRSAAWMAPVM
jgi:hypothetical protein